MIFEEAKAFQLLLSIFSLSGLKMRFSELNICSYIYDYWVSLNDISHSYVIKCYTDSIYKLSQSWKCELTLRTST